ncbi:hypothetical protein BJ165DRAFT_1410459 [Panaeolus papilionaceus]|nr:hypothetical protein BJ165DRAFT_1410459 [Panaeolus papilionaceus]
MATGTFQPSTRQVCQTASTALLSTPTRRHQRATGIIQIFQDALKQLNSQSDDVKQRKSILKTRLAKAKDTFAESALVLIKFRSPPEGYERVIFDYQDLSVKGCLAQAKWIVKEPFGKKA